jgi:hypothetical protein
MPSRSKSWVFEIEKFLPHFRGRSLHRTRWDGTLLTWRVGEFQGSKHIWHHLCRTKPWGFWVHQVCSSYQQGSLHHGIILPIQLTHMWNFVSKSIEAHFGCCSAFIPMYAWESLLGTLAATWAPSITPTLSWHEHEQNVRSQCNMCNPLQARFSHLEIWKPSVPIFNPGVVRADGGLTLSHMSSPIE